MNKSTSFKVSLWLACITTLCIWFVSLGSDALPGAYYIGGPGLMAHLYAGSDSWLQNDLYTGATISLILIIRLAIAAFEGLVVWLAFYWLHRLFMSPGSPVAPERMISPSFAAKTPLSPPPH